MSLGPWEIGLILILVLIVFGAGKLPQIGEMIGKTIRSIRRASSDALEEVQIIEEKSKLDKISTADLEKEISKRK